MKVPAPVPFIMSQRQDIFLPVPQILYVLEHRCADKHGCEECSVITAFSNKAHLQEWLDKNASSEDHLDIPRYWYWFASYLVELNSGEMPANNDLTYYDNNGKKIDEQPITGYKL